VIASTGRPGPQFTDISKGGQQCLTLRSIPQPYASSLCIGPALRTDHSVPVKASRMHSRGVVLSFRKHDGVMATWKDKDLPAMAGAGQFGSCLPCRSCSDYADMAPLQTLVESAPQAYRLKASNAASPISTFSGAMPRTIDATERVLCIAAAFTTSALYLCADHIPVVYSSEWASPRSRYRLCSARRIPRPPSTSRGAALGSFYQERGSRQQMSETLRRDGSSPRYNRSARP
jgi:hypothetical protein